MTERIRERRKIGLAILISLFLHFVVAFSLAAFGDKFTSTPPEEDKPVELTIVDLSATPPPATAPINPPYMETAPSKESVEKPKEQTFESNANSIAASEQPATGDAPVPSQEGKDRPFVNLETHDLSLASQGAKPQPEPEQSIAPQPTTTPAPVATAAPEQFAMLTATPPPPIKSPEETEASPTPEIVPSTPPPAPRPKPELAASSYQAQKLQTRMTGRITNRGPSAVNAARRWAAIRKPSLMPSGRAGIII